MLIMRIYALYERSRKVLAMYIIVAVVIVIVGCVSLGNQHLLSYSISDFVVYSGRCWVGEKRKLGTCKYT
jgi:hypothetical protein